MELKSTAMCLWRALRAVTVTCDAEQGHQPGSDGHRAALPPANSLLFPLIAAQPQLLGWPQDYSEPWVTVFLGTALPRHTRPGAASPAG